MKDCISWSNQIYFVHLWLLSAWQSAWQIAGVQHKAWEVLASWNCSKENMYKCNYIFKLGWDAITDLVTFDELFDLFFPELPCLYNINDTISFSNIKILYNFYPEFDSNYNKIIVHFDTMTVLIVLDSGWARKTKGKRSS